MNKAAPDWRGLCEELANHATVAQNVLVGEGLWDVDEDEGLLDRARAALAQPEPEVVPTDEEAQQLFDNIRVPIYGRLSTEACDRVVGHEPVRPGDFARAVLARWGRPAPAPAEGEVAELVTWLRNMAEAGLGGLDELNASSAADLLEQRHPAPVPALTGELLKEAAWLRNECSAENADGNWISMSIDQALDLASLLERQAAPAPAEGEVVPVPTNADQAALMAILGEKWLSAHAPERLRHPAPVPVAERLPGPEDCDEEGRCWWGLEESDDYEACWTLRKMHGIPFDSTRWLPHYALPLPQGEVE